MANVYVITNEINGKQYVGVTRFSINERFKEHRRDRGKKKLYDRPLYKDMRKYGVENFSVSLLEECDDDIRFDREVYWVEKLNTYKNGYNLTFGGTGKHYCDYEEISNKYLEIKSLEETAKLFEVDTHTVRLACNLNNVEIVRFDPSKSVDMLSIDGEFIKTFHSFKDAAEFLLISGFTSNKSIGGIRAHIIDVCKGKRNAAYGYRWRYSVI